MLRELASSQQATTDATMERLVALFNICFDVSRMGLKP